MSETTQIILLSGIILASGSILIRYGLKRYRNLACSSSCDENSQQRKECKRPGGCPSRTQADDAELTQLGSPKR